MDKWQKEELIRLAGQRVRFRCPMAGYTTLRVGGEADALYKCDTLGNLRKVIAFLSKESIPYLVVGRGSNLLVRDGGLEGVVISFCGELAGIQRTKSRDLTVLTGAGLSLGELLRYCAKEALGGLEFLTLVPGTVGGAVAMNAGAFGREICTNVREIHVVDSLGEVTVRRRSELVFSYRKLDLRDGEILVQVGFKLEEVNPASLAGQIKAYQRRRKATQPMEYPSAGSVFKNPPNDHAGRLIEMVGLKGKGIRGAMFSEKHANFIVNTGKARAKDILTLIQVAREKVKEKTGIDLESEIKIVGRSEELRAGA